MSQEHERSETTRRDLMRNWAIGGAAAAGVVPIAPADEADDQEAVKPRTEADARMDYIIARFGMHLDAAAREVVRSEVESQVRRSEQLRQFEVDNGVGPFPVFRPFGPTDGL